MTARARVWAVMAAAAALGLAGCPNHGPLGVRMLPDGGGGGDALPPGCADGKLDGDESDVDCGGRCGATCAFGQKCRAMTDCDGGVCVGGVCTPSGSSCFDHVRDGTETDVDCGGGCPACDDGKRCVDGADCASGACQAGTCAAGHPPFVFAAARFGGVGRGPGSLVARDFDGDGKLDLATANHVTRDVSVVLGYGDGTFHDPIAIPVVGDPGALLSADLDGDGRPDLATANQDTGTLSILLNGGHGTFRAAPDVKTGKAPASLVAADWNRDGKIDLVSGNQGSGEIGLHLGRGDGSFAPVSLTKLANAVNSVAAGDWDGDGAPDLAAIADYHLVTLRGDGRGGFAMPVAVDGGAFPWFVTALDLRRAGRLDLLTSSYEGFVSVLLGGGDGRFAAPQGHDLGGAPWEIASADFDGDGKLDLAVANVVSDTIHVLKGRGDGGFDSAIRFYVGGSLQAIAVGDFNGDGKPDLALCDYWTHDVGVMLNHSGQ